MDGKPLTLWEKLLDPILDRLVRAKVRARFGGRLVAALSGGARLEPEVGRFFLALGMTIMQGYGQTEAGPVISATPPDAIRIDTVGKPLNGVEVQIAEDGEILVRGELVMDGYWNRPQDTAATIRDGWLHTGDIGELDHGYLRITDRKKDMIVLSGGENVSPAKIEGMLMAEVGDRPGRGDRRRTQRRERARRSRGRLRRRRRGPRRQPDQPASVGDRAHTQACGGGAVHDRKRPADAVAENPAGAGRCAPMPRSWPGCIEHERSHFQQPLRWRGRSARRRRSRFCPIVDFWHASRDSRGTRR